MQCQRKLEVSSRDIPRSSLAGQTVHNSLLGPGRTADWVDGVVGKVYIAGCDNVSARRVYSARVRIYAYLNRYPMGSGGRD